MSAFVAVKMPTACQLLADGAEYLADGTIISFPRKIAVSKEVPFAVAVRARHVDVLPNFGRICDAADDIGVDPMLDLLANEAADLEVWENRVVDLMIAAWSPTKGACTFRIHNCPTLSDAKSFKALNPLPDLSACGTVFEPATLFLSGILPIKTSLQAWARDGGVRLMDMMRRIPGEPPPGQPAGYPYLIGGHVDAATVTADGVVIERVKTWHQDKVGEKIDPFADSKVVPFQSRHQRRAAERQAKKEVRAARA